MSPQDHILIARLLRQREAAFVTVWECEDRVRQILRGADVHFPAPPDLPSRRPRRAAGRPPAAAAATTGGGVRRRRDNEEAYRLTWKRQGQTGESLTTDVEIVRALLALPPDVLRVLRVEAVALDDAGIVARAECLWEAPEELAADTPRCRLPVPEQL